MAALISFAAPATSRAALALNSLQWREQLILNLLGSCSCIAAFSSSGLGYYRSNLLFYPLLLLHLNWSLSSSCSEYGGSLHRGSLGNGCWQWLLHLVLLLLLHLLHVVLLLQLLDL